MPQEEDDTICTKFKALDVKVAKQGNTLDCGLYTIAFAEALLQDPPKYEELHEQQKGTGGIP